MEKILKLSEWAKLKGYSYSHALRLFRRKELKEAFKTETGSIMVKCGDVSEKDTVGYLRLEPGETEENTKLKLEEFKRLCILQEIKVNEIIIEKVSLTDERRPLLIKLLEAERVGKLIITNIEDICFLGKSYLESICRLVSCSLISIKKVEISNKTSIKIIKSLLNRIE